MWAPKSSKDIRHVFLVPTLSLAVLILGFTLIQNKFSKQDQLTSFAEPATTSQTLAVSPEPTIALEFDKIIDPNLTNSANKELLDRIGKGTTTAGLDGLPLASSDTQQTNPNPSNTNTPAGPTQSCLANAQWQLKFSDDFEGDSLRTDKWEVWNSRGQGGNGLRSTSAVSVANGQLNVTAKDINGEVVSGGLGSTFGQQYGRWQVKVRMANRTANTLRPVVQVIDTTRPSGSSSVQLFRVEPGKRTPFLTQSYIGSLAKQTTTHKVNSYDWQIISIDWSPSSVRVSLNGREVATHQSTPTESDRTHELAIQLDATQPSLGSTVEQMQIDWVRIYDQITTCE